MAPPDAEPNLAKLPYGWLCLQETTKQDLKALAFFQDCSPATDVKWHTYSTKSGPSIESS